MSTDGPLIDPYTVILGSNTISNCQAILTVEGEEVFRLRDNTKDGHLVIDFDVCDESGKRLTKVAKNYVTYSVTGFEFENQIGLARVFEKKTGRTVAQVRAIDPRTVEVVGVFCVNGFKVIATPTMLNIGGMTFSQCSFTNSRTAIALGRSQMSPG